MSDLKPCPFCDGTASFSTFLGAIPDEQDYHYSGEMVRCNSCGVCFKEYSRDEDDLEIWGFHNKEKVAEVRNGLAEKWNTRA